MLNVEPTRAISQTVFKFTCVSKAIWQFQFSDPMHNSSYHLSGIVALISEEYLAVSIRLVASEVTLVNGAVAEE